MKTKKRLQFAYRIDTSVVNPTFRTFPPFRCEANPSSLPRQKIFCVGWAKWGPAVGLKHVAESDGVGTSEGPRTSALVRGVDQPAKGEGAREHYNDKQRCSRNNCPLWPYILGEANGDAKKPSKSR